LCVLIYHFFTHTFPFFGVFSPSITPLGPWLLSQVGKLFCELMNISVSLWAQACLRELVNMSLWTKIKYSLTSLNDVDRIWYEYSLSPQIESLLMRQNIFPCVNGWTFWMILKKCYLLNKFKQHESLNKVFALHQNMVSMIKTSCDYCPK
jgi:hypothetical protein